jgi:amidase
MTFVDRHNIAAEGLEVWAQCFRRLQGREIWRTHGDWITREQPRFGPDVAARFAWAAGLVKDGEAAGTVEDNGEGVTDCGGSMDAGILSGLSDFDANSDFSADISFNKMSNFNANSDMSDLEMRAMISRRMRNMLGEDTVLLIPTAPGPAPLRGTLGQDMEEWRTRTMQLTCIAGLAGLPQVSLPVIGPDGLLIGLSVIAGAAQDIKLLRWVVELVDAGLVDAGLVVPEEATAYE